jgi:acyl-CoA synthetase (AMP-forming)/AMP-acid ligase II
LLAPGQRGEIVYKGPQIAAGYLNKPDATESVFLSFSWDLTGEIWYRSGDMGFFNSEGLLEYIGRRDGQFKFAGRRIEVGEIEAVLRRYPQTEDAVVVPLSDESGVVNIIVAVITSELTKDQELQIRKDSDRYLEKIFFPKLILRIDKFPLTNSGKIDRKALAIFAKNKKSL